MAALQAATRNAARALGWEKRTGTIVAGLDADLVLLEANPLEDITNTKKIALVVRVLDREELNRLASMASP
jgi:imidazolonepropionase-like amidohydrolase